MDKILEIIKEKLEAPFLMNYFIGVIIFNKEVTYAILSIDYHDKIGNFYFYNNQQFTNKIELLEGIADNKTLPVCVNLFFLPILYTIIITGGLPYIKSIFNVIHENADILYERFRIYLNKMQTVTKERHDKLNDLYKKLVNDNKVIQDENNSLIAIDTEWKGQNKVLEDKTKKLEEENKDLNSKIKASKEMLEFLEAVYDSQEKTMNNVFQGIWKLDFKFEVPSTLDSGFEYFKIINGCEYHTSNKPEGIFEFRCYIDRYQFEKNAEKHIKGINDNGKLIDRIKFQKTFGIGEFAICEYILLDENNIQGFENYTKVNEAKNNLSSVILTKI